MKPVLYISRDEAFEALEEGKRVLFHYKDKDVEITKDTSLSNLRWELLANTTLTVSDVLNNKYSVIS